MKLKSMKVDKKAREKMYAAEPKADLPEYPYGLELRMNEEILKALGITKLPDVGSYMVLEARVCVRSVEERDDIYTPGGKSRSVTVQIEDMAIEADGKKDD